jgi:hypothetical protein
MVGNKCDLKKKRGWCEMQKKKKSQRYQKPKMMEETLAGLPTSFSF